MLKQKNILKDVEYFRTQSLESQNKIIKSLEDINKLIKVDKPYRIKLLESDIPDHFKACAINKISALKNMDMGSNEYHKLKNWIDSFMRIPFGKYAELPINYGIDGKDKCYEFMNDAKTTLDKCVYGLNDAKMQIMQLLGQWLTNPKAIGNSIAIKGPPGTGKTTLIKNGISKILNRDFAFLALGGATDSSFLEGHSYTYEGSMCGKIVDILIKSDIMNPIIYFDELDKISETPKGEELIGILTHLTDTTQNNQFHDKYFSEIDFDLSKCLFIFSYNDESKINPILKDRMYCIETQGYNTGEKLIIAKDYLIPSIRTQINFNESDILFNDECIKSIIENYCDSEKGVRNMKRCLETIYSKLNLYRLMDSNTNLFNKELTIDVKFPFEVDKENVDKLIKKTIDPLWRNSLYL